MKGRVWLALAMAACIGAVIFPMAHPENAPFVLALVVVYLTAFVVENLRPEGKK